MIDLQHFHELEQLINSGHYSEARHHVRAMLDAMQRLQHSAGDSDERAQLASELLSDTLNMLLLYRHESQITVYPVRAARLLLAARP